LTPTLKDRLKDQETSWFSHYLPLGIRFPEAGYDADLARDPPHFQSAHRSRVG